jgi:hypothetical protein
MTLKVFILTTFKRSHFELKKIRTIITVFGLRRLQCEQHVFKTEFEFRCSDNTL